jgi:hypothetical protein
LSFISGDESEHEFEPGVFSHLDSIVVEKPALSNSFSNPQAERAAVFPRFKYVGYQTVEDRTILHAV